MTILVLEDNANVLSLVERVLSSAGHDVLTAHDTAEAEMAMEEHGDPPDVLLADIILAGDTGVDFARALKQRHPAIRIVFMTGLAHRAPSALRTGLGPVLHKPFRPDELLRLVTEA